MTRIICIALAAVLLLGVFTSCSKKDEGKLVCGVTLFPPMNYLDENGNWTGFETEFAQAVGAKLGMEVEFQQIEWPRKFIELQAGTINCIWNGMTANVVDSVTGRQRYEDVDFSYSYMLNQQAVVIRSSRAGEFQSLGDLVGKTVAAEAGSAGETIAQDAVGESGSLIASNAQIDTFIEVKAGAVDFALIDILLAEEMAGSGDHSDLMIAAIELPAEVYAVGFPKGSPMVAKVNKAIQELFDEGVMTRLAVKYGMETRLKLGTARIEDL
jgi:polar amino acid transport system substrate-binding protein